MAFKSVGAPQSLAQPTIQRGIGSGRLPLLANSPELRNEIIEYVSQGLGFGEACSLAGISRQTMYEFMTKGAKHLRSGDDTEEANFYLHIKMAESHAELEALNRINKAANIPAFWGAAAWYLERRYPDRYGKQDRLTVNSTSKVDVQSINVEANLKDAYAREIISEFAKLTIPSESEGVNTISGTSRVLDDDGEIPLP
jgi:hypothetical protein